MNFLKFCNNKKSAVSIVGFTLAWIFSLLSVALNCNMPSKIARIAICATDSNNGDIVVTGITADKGTDSEDRRSFGEMQLSGSWKIDKDNNKLICSQYESDAKALIEMRDASTVDIDFESSENSGEAEIYINDKLVDSVDLIENSGETIIDKQYNLSYPKVEILTYILYAFRAIALIGLFIMLLFGYMSFKEFIRNKTKINLFRLKSGLITGFFVAISFVLLCTVFQNYIYQNVYKDSVNLTITATGQKSEKALANHIRIRNILVNGAEYDFTKIQLQGGWECNTVDHLIYVYDPTQPVSFTTNIDNIRTIEIVYVEEVGSGIFNVAIDGKTVAVVDSYKNCKWDNDSKVYKVSQLINPYSSYKVLAIIFVLFTAVGYLLNKNNKYYKLFNYLKYLDLSIILAFVTYFFIAFMQSENIGDVFEWMCNYQSSFANGFCIIALLNIAITAIFNKNYRGFLVLSIISMILLTVNYFKIQFRDVPLLPWDFMLISVAGSVVSRFKFTPSIGFILALVIFIVIVVLIKFATKKVNVDKIKLPVRLVTFIVSSAFLVIYAFTFLFNTSINLFEAQKFYSENGFVLAFAESMQYINPVDEPSNYNEATMNEIANKIKNSVQETNGVKPNVIVLMSESFWDITRVKELGFKEELFPTYRNLQKTSLTGELLTNVYNGGTVNSEFEAITGFSVAYLPSEYMPYQRCMRPDFYSINSFLKSNGYDSLAIHPFEKTNYNRSTAYEYLGFEKTLWEDDFDENADRMRGYISDHALTEKIIEEYKNHKKESNSPWFNLSVSMQNHGGYWESTLDSNKKVNVDDSAFTETSRGSIEDLATGLHYADLALGELIDYFKTVDEPTVIVMFGDHMSNAGQIGDTLLDQSSLIAESDYDLSGFGKDTNDTNAHNIYEQRRVPFMAWSNYKNVNKNCGTLSVTQLLPTVLSEYNSIMPSYFYYLKNAQSILPACASGIFVNKDGTCDFVSNMNEEQKKKYEEYWLIEYDYIFGKNYLKNIFDYNIE